MNPMNTIKNDNQTPLIINEKVDIISYKKNRITIISGPPGIGKTSLARIASISCGYNPIIINSSIDGYSIAEFEEKIKDIVYY